MAKFRMDLVVWGDRGWQSVDFGFAPTREAYEHALRQTGRSLAENPYPAEAFGCCVQLERNGEHPACCIVTMRDDIDPGYPKAPWDVYAILAHEALHVWQFMLKTIGEDRPGDETAAYALQHITGALIRAYIETRGKRAARLRKAA